MPGGIYNFKINESLQFLLSHSAAHKKDQESLCLLSPFAPKSVLRFFVLISKGVSQLHPVPPGVDVSSVSNGMNAVRENAAQTITKKGVNLACRQSGKVLKSGIRICTTQSYETVYYFNSLR